MDERNLTMTIRQFAMGTLAAAALGLAACEGLPMPGGAGGALDIPAVEPGVLSEATMKDVTRILSSDAFEGRTPGTPGEEKTIALMIERFTAAGLKPGNGDSWLQEVPLVEITGKDYAPLTIAGKGAPISLDFAKDWVGVTYREEAATTIADSELVFVGYGINAPEKGWNDYAGLDVKGKTVVILVNDPDWQSAGLEGPFNGKAMTYRRRKLVDRPAGLCPAGRECTADDADERLADRSRRAAVADGGRAGSGRADESRAGQGLHTGAARHDTLHPLRQ